MPPKSRRQNSVVNSHPDSESNAHNQTVGGARQNNERNMEGGGIPEGNPGGGNPGGQPPLTLVYELIQSLQQNQGELAESIRQLKESNNNRETHGGNGRNHEERDHHDERDSNNKNDTPFVTMLDVELLKEPYPEKYDTSNFSLFDGQKGSAVEHINKFLDSMGPFAGNGGLCLREFSKSLVDRAYTWYAMLPGGSIRVWEDMVESFCSKYFHMEEKITLFNLHSTKQLLGEDLLKYIHRFRDISLDCHVKYEESELVEVCMDNMLPEFRAHLENLDISQFAPLLQKARKTALSVKPHSEKVREKKSQHQAFTVSTAAAPSGNKRKRPVEKIFEEPPPLPFTVEEMMVIFDKWVKDEVIKLPQINKPHTEEEKGDPKFCRYHRVHKNPFPNHGKEKGKAIVSVVIQGSTSDMEVDESAAADATLTPAAVRTLQKSPKFKSLFNQLGLGSEARNAATEAIIAIAADSGATCFTVEAHASHVQVRRALVDTGSCLNLIPLSTLKAANIPQKKIQGAPIECIKGRLNGKPIRIVANPSPFDQNEAHFIEAALYDELSAEEPPIIKPSGTPLPDWEDIKDDADVDLRELLERKKKRKERAAEDGNAPQCIRVQMPDGRIVYLEKEEAKLEKSIEEDPKITSKKDLEVINLSHDPGIDKPVSISMSLSAMERTCLIDLLREYQDVLAWKYDKMPRIDPGLVAHSLNVEPGTRPVVQPHPRWLSNIVLVKKKNGQIRCCVDFRNLNKACPKDEFPLPNMDLLIDSAVGNAMFSFMDGFSGYNQIRMSPKDAEKIAFRTPIGNFYYTVIPFGLKNAGATYQRTMTTMFHDMIHQEIEDYVDDIVVKSKRREDHLEVLRRVFERCQLFKLKINPLKCAFGVSAGKFLGFLVHNSEIDVDLAKASAIATMKLPTSHKELKSFLERLSYIRRFIPEAFEKIQTIMTKLPTVCAPTAGKPLRLYLASNSQAIGAQEDNNGTEQPVYYVSRGLKDTKTRYSVAKRACLALISTISQEVPGEVREALLVGMADSMWTLRFDGSSTSMSSEAGIVLIREDGEAIAKSFKLDFSCSNNATEYEAYITGLAIEHEMGIKHLKVIGDSNLIICQAKGEFSLNEPSLAPYRALTQRLEEKFSTFEVTHALRSENRYADALAALGSQLAFKRPIVDVTINKRSIPITELLKEEYEECGRPKSVEGFCTDLWRPLSQTTWRDSSKVLMKEAHSGECGEHQGKKRLYQLLLTLGYYWPTMKRDTADFVKACHTCQMQANLIHTHPINLQNMATPWPYHTWGLDLIGPINSPFGGYIWILAVTEYFTKWVEAIPLRKATGAAVANFIREHIITRFGIPHKIISDNGNGQAKATNRMLLRILSKMVFDYGKGWSSHLADVLWAYRGSPKTATGFTPFSLVYGTDVISPPELLVPSPQMMQGTELEANIEICAEARVVDLESLDESRELALTHHVRRGLPSPSKFTPNWERPYVIREAHDSGYYRLSKADGIILADPINGKWLKQYYS
uniref:Integrase catalytic domain-containing protein n=1 Tax=Fagus sylvatica TaxID=28930 RepID=A0A2N9GDJ2_FAGSY